MDHSTRGKELAGHSYSISFSSKWRPVTIGVSQGLMLGLVLFCIFIGDVDSGIVCTLSKFTADTTLCGAVDTMEVKDAIQKDLDRLEKLAHVSLLMSSKAHVRTFAWIKSIPTTQAGLRMA